MLAGWVCCSRSCTFRNKVRCGRIGAAGWWAGPTGRPSFRRLGFQDQVGFNIGCRLPTRIDSDRSRLGLGSSCAAPAFKLGRSSWGACAGAGRRNSRPVGHQVSRDSETRARQRQKRGPTKALQLRPQKRCQSKAATVPSSLVAGFLGRRPGPISWAAFRASPSRPCRVRARARPQTRTGPTQGPRLGRGRHTAPDSNSAGTRPRDSDGACTRQLENRTAPAVRVPAGHADLGRIRRPPASG